MKFSEIFKDSNITMLYGFAASLVVYTFIIFLADMVYFSWHDDGFNSKKCMFILCVIIAGSMWSLVSRLSPQSIEKILKVKVVTRKQALQSLRADYVLFTLGAICFMLMLIAPRGMIYLLWSGILFIIEGYLVKKDIR